MTKPSLRGRLRHLGPRQRPRFRGPSFNRLIPNLMTMIGLCFGLVAIRFGIEGRFPQAASFIVVAACVMFAVCSSLRLARFNAASIAEPGVIPPPKPAYAYNFFQGVPAPAGAGLALFPLFASLAFEEWEWDGLAHALRFPLFSAITLFVVGGLMVSTLPSWSFKNFKVPAQMVLPLLLGTGAFIAFLVTEPWAALALGGALYMGMLVLSARSYARLKAEAEAMIAAEPPPPLASEG
jgi:CDP-diacylglycerol--serine O-phosphatidyltransferase